MREAARGHQATSHDLANFQRVFAVKSTGNNENSANIVIKPP